MKVAVDATAIPANRLGVGVYVTELLRRITDVELDVFVNADQAIELATVLGGARLYPVRVANRAARIAWTHTVLPRRLKRLRPDVFWGPHYEVPSGVPCPSVVTFHDPTFFTMPQVHERAKVAYFTRAARSGVRKATRVIAVSEYARRGAVDHAGADPSCVDVVHEGIDLQRYVPAEGPPTERPFVFFVGALAPHKNVPGLIAAFDDLDVPHELVIAGPRAWGADDVDTAIATAKKRSITLSGFVSDDEKVRRLQHAAAFVYPSLAEGFGLPVLEAMACGAPTITTTGSAPEEIADGAALLVPPGDTDALRDALRRVLTEPETASSLRALGPQRAAGFTWDAAARKTVEVWRRAAAR